MDVPDEPLIAEHPEVPAEVALRGFDAARAYSANPDASRRLFEQGLYFEPREWEPLRAGRAGRPAGRAAAASTPSTRRRRRRRPGRGHGPSHRLGLDRSRSTRPGASACMEGGASPTPVIDRFYFKSIYFREPSGVLFEIATLGPGFTVDEPLESLGEKLSLPPDFEHLREQVEPNLKPIVNPRTAVEARVGTRLAAMSVEGGLVHRVREPAGEPEGALILLPRPRHRRERPLSPARRARPRAQAGRASAPGAPLTNVPPGGRHWYVVEEVGQPDEDTFMSTIQTLSRFCDDFVRSYGVRWDKTIIGGFSQGAAMALSVGLGDGRAGRGRNHGDERIPPHRARLAPRPPRPPPGPRLDLARLLRQHDSGRLRPPRPRRPRAGRSPCQFPREPGSPLDRPRAPPGDARVHRLLRSPPRRSAARGSSSRRVRALYRRRS